LKIPIHPSQQRAGGVAQGIGPELNSSTTKKKKKKKERKKEILDNQDFSLS
jgi:hypothetical protein